MVLLQNWIRSKQVEYRCILFQKQWYAKFQTVWQGASVYGIAAGYCIFVAVLSIINKWAIMKFPYPGALTALQYLTSVVAVLILGILGKYVNRLCLYKECSRDNWVEYLGLSAMQ